MDAGKPRHPVVSYPITDDGSIVCKRKVRVARNGYNTRHKADAAQSALASRVVDAACALTGSTRELVMSRRRIAGAVNARALVYRWLWLHTSLDKTEIGRMFGRTHSSVIHIIRALERKADVDVGVKYLVSQFDREMSNA